MNENTTEGPLTATLGERLGDKAEEVEKAVADRPRAGREIPWVPVIAAAAVWLLVRSMTGSARRRVRSVAMRGGRAARRLARRR
jgi:hypothetical protein